MYATCQQPAMTKATMQTWPHLGEILTAEKIEALLLQYKCNVADFAHYLLQQVEQASNLEDVAAVFYLLHFDDICTEWKLQLFGKLISNTKNVYLKLWITYFLSEPCFTNWMKWKPLITQQHCTNWYNCLVIAMTRIWHCWCIIWVVIFTCPMHILKYPNLLPMHPIWCDYVFVWYVYWI